LRILLAEDDRETSAFLAQRLGELGHVVRRAGDGMEAAQLGAAETFDAIVLDRMLPGLEGLAVLERLRAIGVATPILVLTARGGIADRVDGLNAGADDYLVKPFALDELVARLNALVRRPPITDVVLRLEVGDIAMDVLRRIVTRADRPIAFQPREFAMLELLMRNAGRIVTRTMFLEQVWGLHFDPQTNIVESNLSRMRSKLRHGFPDDPIETVRGSGYRIGHAT
jgi:two-component system OmpR family response regulator